VKFDREQNLSWQNDGIAQFVGLTHANEARGSAAVRPGDREVPGGSPFGFV